MKKIIMSLGVIALLGSGTGISVGAETKNQKVASSNLVETQAVTWVWYYTDTTLNDGWFEMWFREKNGTRKKKETYNSEGRLMKTTYY